MGGASGWLWARYRRQYMRLMVAVIVVVLVVPVMLPSVGCGAIFLGLTMPEFLLWYGLSAVAILPVAVVGAVRIWPEGAQVARWGAGDRSGALATWDAAIAIPQAFVSRIALASAVPVVTWITAIGAWLGDLSMGATVALAGNTVVCFVAAALLVGVGLQLLLRPVLAEVIPVLPAGATPSRSGWSISNGSWLRHSCWGP